MLDSIPFTILIATILGFLAGIGVGGGSLLILWLTLILEMPIESAQFLNLLFFLPSAIIASLFHKKQGSLDIKVILPAVVGGCIAAGILSYISPVINDNLIRKAFGILLFVTGFREIFYKQKHNQRRNAR